MKKWLLVLYFESLEKTMEVVAIAYENFGKSS